MPSLPLYISPSLQPSPSSTEIASILKQIRSTSYIDEVTSGETSREESGLWNAVYPFDLPSLSSAKQSDLTKFTLNDLPTTVQAAQGDASGGEQVEFAREGYVVVDEQTLKDGSLLVVETRKGGESLRIVPRSLIEVVSRG